MKGLSLQQPWASLVAVGAKRIETRSWQTSYRGELLIHASKGFPGDCQALCWQEPFARALIDGGYVHTLQLPLGDIVAVATLAEVVSVDTVLSRLWAHNREAALREQAFGNFAPGRFAWLLSDIRKLPHPIPAAHLDKHGNTKPGGALGLWSVPQVVVDLLAGQGVLEV